jgi:hypothetical protein
MSEFYTAVNVEFTVIFKPISLDNKELLIETDILAVDGIQVRPAHTQIIDGIQDIGFSNSICSHYTIHPAIEVEFPIRMISEINQGKRRDVHGAKVHRFFVQKV